MKLKRNCNEIWIVESTYNTTHWKWEKNLKMKHFAFWNHFWSQMKSTWSKYTFDQIKIVAILFRRSCRRMSESNWKLRRNIWEKCMWVETCVLSVLFSLFFTYSTPFCFFFDLFDENENSWAIKFQCSPINCGALCALHIQSAKSAFFLTAFFDYTKYLRKQEKNHRIQFVCFHWSLSSLIS